MLLRIFVLIIGLISAIDSWAACVVGLFLATILSSQVAESILCVVALVVFMVVLGRVDRQWDLLAILSLIGLFAMTQLTGAIELWLAMDLVVLSFLGITGWGKTLFRTESATALLVLGGLGSLLVVFGLVGCLSTCGLVNLSDFALIYIADLGWLPNIVTIGISMKIALAPLHLWAIVVLEGRSWPSTLWITTLPSIGWAFVVPYLLVISGSLLVWVRIISLVIGAVGALKQYHIKRLLALSSVSSNGWLVLASLRGWGGVIWAAALAISSIVLWGLCGRITLINQLSSLRYYDRLVVLISLASVGGLPITLGFFAKVVAVGSLFTVAGPILSVVALMASRLSILVLVILAKVMLFETAYQSDLLPSQNGILVWLSAVLLLWLVLFI